MRSLFVAAVVVPSLVASLASVATAQPAYPQPAYPEPAYPQPAYPAPMYAEPAYQAPGMTPPTDAGLVEEAHRSPNDYEPGIVPEGMNAFIGKRRHVHASLLGTSTVTLGRDTELGTYLLGDVMLFPNLSLERQIAEGERGAASILLGAGAGALPIPGGGAILLPGAAGAAGGVGVFWGSFQSATLVVSGRSPTNAWAASVNGGAFVMEGGLAVIGGGVVVGGNGAAAVPVAGSWSTHRFGGTGGVEFDKTFGRRDALVVAADVWVVNPQSMSDATGLAYPRVTWSHRFERWQLTGGAYALIDLPAMHALHSKMPVGPFFNVSWNWGRR